MTFDCTKHIDTARTIFTSVLDLHRALDGRDSYEVKRAHDVVFGMVERFLADAPFHVGDQVELAETPDINQKDSWGWMGSRHFLIKGARGVVRSIDFDPERKVLLGMVMFDDESWKDQDGVVHPIERDKHVYCFSERWLRRVSEEKTEVANATP